MSRIELRYCTPYIRDGLAGVGAINGTPPVAGATTMTIDGVVLNTLDTDEVPLGARFTVVGEGGENEIQTITLDAGVTDGTFTLTFGAQTTTALAHDITTAGMAIALKALTSLEDADVAVTGVPGAWIVTFIGGKATTDVGPITGDGASLTGTVKTVTVTETNKGVVAATATVHTVTSCTPTSGTTTDIVFTPALGVGVYLDSAVITFQGRKLEIKVGEGDVKYTTAKQYHYDKDRGLLDTVRQGDDVEMEVSLNFTWQYTRSGTNQAISPEEAFTQTGAAAGWVSTGEDCEPYAVDFVVEYVPPFGSSNVETYVFPMFRGEKYDHAFKDSNVALNGKCNATEPTITRG